MNQIAELFQHSLLCVSGKGGVGKSTVSASLGLLAASMGKRVLVVESSAQEQIPSLVVSVQKQGLFPRIGHQETEVGERISLLNLSGRECFREYVVDHLKMHKLYDKIFDRKLMRSFLESMPGLAEIMMLGRLYHTCMLRKPPRDYDLVIFDAPASGHFFNLFNTPSAIIDSGLVGPLVKEIKKVFSFLSDPALCGLVLVSLPQELIRSETEEFIPKIEKTLPLAIKKVVLNQTYPATEDVSQFVAEGDLESYAKKKISIVQSEQGLLYDWLCKNGRADLYTEVPDLGFLPEPFDRSLVESLWKASL